MPGEKIPAFLKSHQWRPKKYQNNRFRVPIHFATNCFTFEKIPPPSPLLHPKCCAGLSTGIMISHCFWERGGGGFRKCSGGLFSELSFSTCSLLFPPPLSQEMFVEEGSGNRVVAELANTENTLRRGFTKNAFLFFFFSKDLCSDKDNNRVGSENRWKRGKRHVWTPVFWPFPLPVYFAQRQ